jgi:uncharacterized protein YcfL
MKKLWILFLIHTLLFASCNAQNKKNKTDSNLVNPQKRINTLIISSIMLKKYCFSW